MQFTFKNVTKKVNSEWLKFLLLNKKKLKKILKLIELERTNEIIIFPKPIYLFRTLRYFPPKETKIVLLGQDPYPGYETHNNKIVPYACGLSFSVSKKIRKLPGSLKNIFKEIKNCYPNYNIPNNGSLHKWVKNEKILLLNSSLTTVKLKAGKHLKYWENFTDLLIKWISDNLTNIIFVFMGNYAKKKIKLININKHHILTCVHPSPLSAHRGFFGCNIFKKINNLLTELKKEHVKF